MFSVTGCAPQLECEVEEKEKFLRELDEVSVSLEWRERWFLADLSQHVSAGNSGYE